MSKYRIRMNGKVYEMEIELVDENPETISRPQIIPGTSYKTTDSVVQVINPSAELQIHFDDNTVKSPMPGSIIRVMAKAGEIVSKDTPILVLEAMKMENEICAPRDGRIKEVFVVEGQTVPGTAPLFEMEAEEGKLV